MLALPTLSNSTPSLTPPSVNISPLPSDRVSSRATSVAAPAPLSNLQVNNNNGNPTAQVSAQSSAESAAATNGARGASSTPPAQEQGTSTLFLTQLFGQDSEQQAVAAQAAVETTHIAPAPEYNTFVAYGTIKYKPSGAGEPFVSYNQSDEKPTTREVKPSNDYQRYQATTSRNTANLGSGTPQLLVAG